MHIMSSMVQKNNMTSKRNVSQIVGTILFILYGCVLIYFLFFAEEFGRKNTDSYNLNLVPFKEITRFLTRKDVLGTKAAIINIGGNILAFVPFGFLIVPIACFYIKSETGVWGKFFRAVLMTLNLSLTIEIIQLISKVGSFDVDDLMLNTLGGIIGAGIYVLYSLVGRKKSNGKA